MDKVELKLRCLTPHVRILSTPVSFGRSMISSTRLEHPCRHLKTAQPVYLDALSIAAAAKDEVRIELVPIAV
jgi:hypothetical protein